ncbi:Maf family protein [Bacteroidota bacterium]
MKQIKKLLNLTKPLILASKSPRRNKLLKNLGFDFEVIPSEFKEDKQDFNSNYKEYVKYSAYKKAEDVAKRTGKPALILGADTIVVLNNQILHKPKDEEDAFRILKTLSGNTHIVYTGIALIDTENNKNITDVQATEVTFRELDDDEIQAYIETGSPMDKAGAYGIQDDFGAVFVSHINGCYYNIVGLPLELLYTSMKKLLKIVR